MFMQTSIPTHMKGENDIHIHAVEGRHTHTHTHTHTQMKRYMHTHAHDTIFILKIAFYHFSILIL